jgi:hypothetical protein
MDGSVENIQFLVTENASLHEGYMSPDVLIGGFHTLCAQVSYMQGDQYYVHPFSDHVVGGIHINSVWDLYHRSSADQRGFYYSPTIKKWVSIYLMSEWGTFPEYLGADVYPPVNGGLVSKNNALIADGFFSAHKWHGDKFAQFLGMQGMRLPTFDEFVMIAFGSPEESVFDAYEYWETGAGVTTGGHYSGSGQRIISYEGAEDATGVAWQWCAETSGYGGSYGMGDPRWRDECDIQVRGKNSGDIVRLLAGGSCLEESNPEDCGSRASFFNSPTEHDQFYHGCRAVAEPLH